MSSGALRGPRCAGFAALLWVLALVPRAWADDIPTRRLVVHPGEQIHLDLGTAVESVTTVDPSIAEVMVEPMGLSVRGGRLGTTTVNVFDTLGLVVVVVAVEPSPRPTSPPQSPSTLVTGDLSSLMHPTHLWGINRYQVTGQLDSTGAFSLVHELDLRGKLGDGEYSTSTYVSQLTDRTRLESWLLSWTNEDQTQAYDLGDTGGQITGSRLGAGVGLLGVHLHTGKPSFAGDFFAGSMRLLDHDLDAPVVGDRIGGQWMLDEDRRLDVAAGAVGYSLPSGLGNGRSRTGVVLGTDSTLQSKSGLYSKLEASLSASRDKDARESALGTELNGTVGYSNQTLSGTLNYSANSEDYFVLPLQQEALGERILSAAGSYRQPEGIGLTATASRRWLENPAGGTLTGNGLGLNLTAPLDKTTQLGTYASLSTSVVPLTIAAQRRVISFTQRAFGAAATHRFSGDSMGALTATLRQQDRDDATQNLFQVDSVFQTMGQKGRWDASANAGLDVISQSQLAVDQRPLALQARLGLQGRVVENVVAATGGFSLQTQLTPEVETGVAINIGVQLAPTLAHRLSASLNVNHPMGAGTWSESGNITYTYLFGADVHSEPLFEFMRRGELHGRVCFDANGDGECGPTERAIGNVMVRLSNGMSVRTDADGRYSFDGLKPGYYSVVVDEADLRRMGRLDRASEQSFELKPRETEVVSFGVVEGCRVDGWVSNDLDLDGIAAVPEPRMAKVAVTVLAPDGTHTVTTDPSGAFVAELKHCGSLAVTVDPGSLPPSYMAPEDPTIIQARPGETPTVALAVRAIRTLQGTVFVDLNRNGKLDAGEPRVEGARVMYGDGSIATDGLGRFLIRHVPAGPLRLRVVQQGLPPELAPGPEQTLTLPPGPVRMQHVDLPIQPKDRS